MKALPKDILPATIAVLVFTLVCGLAYPLLVTGVSQVLFRGKADGSLVKQDGKIVGSRLIGQDFSRRKDLFQSRPSVTGYNPAATYFNNRGPNQATLSVQQHRFALDYAAREGIPLSKVPADAATTSASGVDPHMSVANARIQSVRVARETGIPHARVLELIEQNTDDRGLGVFGEPGVNVLELNLAIEKEQGR
jgi:potassium-transporting ATPase KdpC subunit